MAICLKVNIKKFLEYYSCIRLRTTCFILGYVHLSFNSFDTLCLLAIAKFGESLQISDYSDIEAFGLEDQFSDFEKLYTISVGTPFIIVICLNMIWLLASIGCLIGLHLNKPGPIRTFVTLIASRVLVLIAGFAYTFLNHSLRTEYVAINLADFGCSFNFVIVYYLYAVQLKHEIVEEMKLNKFKDKGVSTHKTKVDLQKIV